MSLSPKDQDKLNALREKENAIRLAGLKLDETSIGYEDQYKRYAADKLKNSAAINKLLGQELGTRRDSADATKELSKQLKSVNAIQTQLGKQGRLYADHLGVQKLEVKILNKLSKDAEKTNARNYNTALAQKGVASQLLGLREEMLDNEMRLGKSSLQSISTDYARDKLLQARRAFQSELHGMGKRQVETALENLRYLEQTVVTIEQAGAKTAAITEKAQGLSSAIVAPFENMKSAIESLPGGGMLSNVLGLSQFTDQMTKNVTIAMQTALVKGPSAGLEVFRNLTKQIPIMLGPLALMAIAVAGIAALFIGISKTAKETATSFGVSFAQAKKLNDAARQAQSTFGTQLATMEDITAVQKEQITLLGSAALVNTKVAAGVADMGKAFGYGAEQAGKTHSALMLIGASQEQASQIQLNTNKKALEAGVSVAAVQKDIADNAAGALKYLGGSAEAMADAAVKAAKLGVSLGTMVKVSNALLDIEGSLTSQFEFQALTGKDINLDLARQKALQGDIAGATEEALKAVKSSAEFDKMGVFAKDALAKATGVSVEELQKSLLIQEKLGNLTDDQKAAAANLGLSAAEMKNMSAEELKNKLAQQQSMDKAGAALESMKSQLTTALLPLAEAFGAVFTLLGPVLKAIGMTIKTLLSPIQLISNLLSGSTGEMSTFQKIAGGVLTTFLAIKGVTMALNAAAGIRNSLEATYGTMTAKGYFRALATNAVEKARNALKVVGNFLMSGRVASLATENTLQGTGNALAIAGNVQEGITTGAKATQLGLEIGKAAAMSTTAAATGGAVAGQTTLAAATGVAAGAQAGLAAAALTTNAAMTFGIGTVIAIAAAAGAIGLLIGHMSKSSSQGKNVGDLSSPAKGTTQISTSEGGVFNTSPNDDVAAGPGIISRLKGAASNPLGALGSLFGGGESDSGGGGMNNEAILTKLDQIITACNTPPPVYIGNKAVTELASALQINESFQTTQNVSGEAN
jgi:hypothetical protein